VDYDSLTGHYASVVKMDADYIMTVKSEGAAYSSRYFEMSDTTKGRVMSGDLEVKKLHVGETYNLKRHSIWNQLGGDERTKPEHCKRLCRLPRFKPVTKGFNSRPYRQCR